MSEPISSRPPVPHLAPEARNVNLSQVGKLLQVAKWIEAVMSRVNDLKVSSLSELALDPHLRQELYEACCTYYKGCEPPALASQLLDNEVRAWAAPMADPASIEILLTANEGDDRARTLRLEVFTGNDCIEVYAAYWRQLVRLPENDLPELHESQKAHCSEIRLSDSFLDACMQVEPHIYQKALLRSLREKIVMAVSLPQQGQGVAAQSIVITADTCVVRGYAGKSFYRSALLSVVRLPEYGVLLENGTPASLLIEALPASGSQALQSAALYRGDVLLGDRTAALSVFGRVPFATAQIVPSLSPENRMRVAKDICSKLMMMHAEGRSYVELNLENVVTDVFEEPRLNADGSDFDLELLPCNTRLVRNDSSVDSGAFKQFGLRINAFYKVIKDLASLREGPDDDLELKYTRQLGIDASLGCAFCPNELEEEALEQAFQQLERHMKQELRSLMQQLSRHLGSTNQFCDPRLSVTQAMLKRALRLLSVKRPIDWGAVADMCDRISSKVITVDLLKSDIWSLGLCLIALAVPAEAKEISKECASLSKAYLIHLHGNNLLQDRMAESDVAQGWQHFISRRLWRLERQRAPGAGVQQVLLNTAALCLRDDLKQRPTVEEVLELLQPLS